MILHKRSQLELEEENLKKTMDIMRGIMEAGKSNELKPAEEDTFKRSSDKIINKKTDKK